MCWHERHYTHLTNESDKKNSAKMLLIPPSTSSTPIASEKKTSCGCAIRVCTTLDAPFFPLHLYSFKCQQSWTTQTAKAFSTHTHTHRSINHSIPKIAVAHIISHRHYFVGIYETCDTLLQQKRKASKSRKLVNAARFQHTIKCTKKN